jgi:hypothetical protein
MLTEQKTLQFAIFGFEEVDMKEYVCYILDGVVVKHDIVIEDILQDPCYYKHGALYFSLTRTYSDRSVKSTNTYSSYQYIDKREC